MGWENITSESCTRGRIVEHNVFKEKSGPTSYAKRNIENGYAISSGWLLIDDPMLRPIKNCTEEEAHRQLGENEWSTTVDELDAFISILYARGNNSWSLYKEVTGKKITRREYLQQLIEVLRSAYIHKSKEKSDAQTKADTTEECAQMRKTVHCKDF
ncbi:DDE_Tnp_1_7 domain-containing protein [Trichonephila clavipes]|nr:DDE_Tnp_1_7 domain-containing protein [Trichonephila clavipes]